MTGSIVKALLICAATASCLSAGERPSRVTAAGHDLLEAIGERAEARAVSVEREAQRAVAHADVVKKFKELDVIVDTGPASLPKVIAYINQFTTSLVGSVSDLTAWTAHELTELKGIAQAGNHAGVETELHEIIGKLTAAPVTRPVVLAWLKKLDVLVDAGNCAGAVKMVEAYEHDVLDPNAAPLAGWTCDRLDAMLVPLKQNNAAAADKLLKVLIADLSKP